MSCDVERYAVIENGVVTNCIMYCPDIAWQKPSDATLLRSDVAQIGDAWDGAQFSYVDPVSGNPLVR